MTNLSDAVESGRVQLEEGSGEFTCLCGNDVNKSGAYPCDGDGNEVPPDQNWSDIYCCAKCGRIFDGTTGDVRKQVKLSEPGLPELSQADVDAQDKTDWQYQVANGDTVLGLEEWKRHRDESEGKALPFDLEREERIRALAKSQHVKDGELEIDAGATISAGDDNGAYVQAWVWVDFSGTELDKTEKESEVPHAH